jgi:hypothetical protein
MKKIAKVITSCNDCEHLIKGKTNETSNKTNIALCGFPSESNTPFLIEYAGEDSITNYLLDIPNNCELEDYHLIKRK